MFSVNDPSVPSTGEMVKLVAVQQGLTPSAVTPSSRLVEDLNVDSLEMQSLLLAIEEAFGVMLHADDLAKVVSVADLAAVTAKQAAGLASPS